MILYASGVDEYFQFLLWKQQMQMLAPLIAGVVFSVVVLGAWIHNRVSALVREYQRQRKGEQANQKAWNEPPAERKHYHFPWSK